MDTEIEATLRCGCGATRYWRENRYVVFSNTELDSENAATLPVACNPGVDVDDFDGGSECTDE